MDFAVAPADLGPVQTFVEVVVVEGVLAVDSVVVAAVGVLVVDSAVVVVDVPSVGPVAVDVLLVGPEQLIVIDLVGVDQMLVSAAVGDCTVMKWVSG